MDQFYCSAETRCLHEHPYHIPKPRDVGKRLADPVALPARERGMQANSACDRFNPQRTQEHEVTDRELLEAATKAAGKWPQDFELDDNPPTK